MVSNTVENIAIGAGSAAATYAAVEAWRRASERTVLDGKTVRSTRVDAARLSADADTFQFKSGGDRSGVTDRLAGVKTWNAAAAGKVMVYEYADGRQVIADGHQRTGLAKRLMSDGHAPIKMDALVLREADGWSPRDVRAYAAIKNMHESSGNALDMAKIMRERPDLVTSSLPMSDAKVREASALSRLSDKAFGMVVGGGVEPGAAAAVGEAVKDATRHADMIAEMSEAKVRGAQHARLYVQQALSAPSVAETTSSLFGEETHTRSLIKERSAVLDRALTSLKSNRKLFGMLEREADTIEAAGNKLARQANSSNADTAGRLSALVEKLATQRGNVSKMLDDAARAVASGEPAAKAGRAFLKSVQGAMEQGGIRALVGDAPLPMAASGGMQRMVDRSTKVDVTTPGIRDAKIGDTKITYQVGNDGTVKVASIRTPKDKRGAGSARAAMQRFLQETDAKGLKVSLDASPLDAKTGTGGLVKFYESMGFSKTGHTINPMGDPEMVRDPAGKMQRMVEKTDKPNWRLRIVEPKTPFEGWSGYITGPDGKRHMVAGPTTSSTHDTKRSFMLEANRQVARLSNGTASYPIDGKASQSRMVEKSAYSSADGQKRLMAESMGLPSDAYTRKVDTARPGDYGADPLGDGKFKMVPSGDVVDYGERMHRLGPGKGMPSQDWKPAQTAAPGQSSFLPAPTTKEQIAAAAKSAGKPGVMQQDVGGLFGDGMKQMDLVDEARKNAARDANVKLVQDKWLADRGITSLDQVKSMTQPERENLAREWEKVSKPIDRKGPVGWSDAAREGSAKSRGVALPGEAKPVVPVKAGKAKGAPKPTAKGAKILDLYHGTAAPKFDTFKSGNSDGMRGGAPYLTSDYKAAERYAKMAAERTGGTPRVLRVQVEAEKVMSTGSNWMKQSQISGLMKRVLGREVGMKAFDDFARTSVTGPPGNKGAQGATVYKSLADAVGGANALNERLAKAGVTAVKFDQPAAFWGNTSYNIRDAVAVLDPSRARIVDQDYRPAPKAKAPSAAPKAPKAPPVAQLRADAAKAGIPAAAQMKKPELMSLKKAGKFMGPLAIIGAGAVAFDGTRNQAHAAGKSESAANLDAAGAAAIASGSVAAIGYGIGKVVQAAARVAPVAGKVLSRAVPLAALGAAAYEIGGGAIAGFKKDGLAGAAKGAGVGAMDFATLGAYSHFASKGQMGRLTPEQEAQFASADQGYRAGQEQQKAAATTDDGSGWTDQARIAAYMKRIANAGGTPQNMPYGGKPRQTPASSGTWAQANVAVPGGPAKGKN